MVYHEGWQCVFYTVKQCQNHCHYTTIYHLHIYDDMWGWCKWHNFYLEPEAVVFARRGTTPMGTPLVNVNPWFPSRILGNWIHVIWVNWLVNGVVIELNVVWTCTSAILPEMDRNCGGLRQIWRFLPMSFLNHFVQVSCFLLSNSGLRSLEFS